MHVNNRPVIVSFAMKAMAGAVASAVLLSSSAHAAGLGKLTVMSSLGQPLRAEIELTSVSSEEAGGLAAKLASPEAFRLANIDFNPALLGLRFAVEQRGGRQVIRITSSQPLNEPFVDMLVELSWASGRLVREYTFLLDPAELRATQPAQVAASQAPARTTPAPAPAAAAPAAPAAPAVPDYRPAAKPAQPAPAEAARVTRQPVAASQYKVRPGDTLGRIAGQLKPVDISLDMMLVALYRANPDAFVGENMNRLKAGRILSVPDAATIRGTGAGEAEARGVVVAHAADFNAYRSKLAGQVATAAPTRTPDAGRSAAGQITARVEERPTAVNESKDQLRLSKATPAANAEGKTTASTEEDRIAKDRALAEATARVKELERNVSELEKLMTVKSQAGVAATAPAAQQPSPAAAAPAPVKPAAPALVKTPPPAEPSFFDMLIDNISYVLAGIGILLLAMVGIASARRRTSAASNEPTEPSILGAPTDQAHSLFAEAGGQSVDTNNSVFNSSFAPSASQLDTNEVDPVAEADVYIAYGRDAQAEEILKEALRNHPERHPVRLKLLEIYAARKDQRAFEAQAGEMYGLTKGQGDEWAQAAALGLMLDPRNPLYANAGDGNAVPEPSAQERDQQALLAQQFDAAPEAQPVQDNAMDFDLGLAPQTAAPAPADEAPEAIVAAPLPADDNGLDFDLAFEPVPQAEPASLLPAAASTVDEPEAAAPVERESAFDMDFDMSFDSPAADTAAADEATAVPAPVKSFNEMSLDLGQDEPEQDFGTVDLSREFDVPPVSTGTKTADTLPDSLLDLDAMNFDLPVQPVDGNPGVTGARDEELATNELFAVPDLPFDPLDEATPAASAAPQMAAPQFDMSGIDLDLPPAEPAQRGDETALPDLGDFGSLGALDAGDADISTADMEMETKLDLAIAYQEIGDKEGARELLDEVIKGGNAAQVGKANAMRAQIG